MTGTVSIKAGDLPLIINISGSSSSKSEDGKSRFSSSSYTSVRLDAGEEYTSSVFKGQSVSVREAQSYDLKELEAAAVLDELDI